MVGMAQRVDAPWDSSSVLWPKPRPRAAWTGQSNAARNAWREEIYIPHPPARATFEDAWDYIPYCSDMKSSFAMLIVGEGGSGKTKFTKQFAAYVNAAFGRQDPEKTVMPALVLEKLPSPCTPNEICWAILRALGDPNPKKRKRDTLKEQVAKLLKECEVRVVMLDNIQDVPTARGEKGIEQVGTVFRDLIDLTNLLWMFLGTNKAYEVIDADKQLIKRVKYRSTLPYFGMDGAVEMKNFLRVLQHFDDWLPLAESSWVMLKEKCGVIHIASEGVMERLTDLLSFGSMFAVKSRREVLQVEDLGQAFRKLMGPGVANPFDTDYVVRRLDRKHEPFAVMKAPRRKESA